MPPLGRARHAAEVPSPSLRTPSPEEMARFDGHRGNNTTFGKILRGELPSRVLSDDDAVSLAFVSTYTLRRSIRYLVIPKRWIYHAGYLTPADRALVRHLLRVAELVAAANGVADGTVKGAH